MDRVSSPRGGRIAVTQMGDGPGVVLIPSQGRGVEDFADLAGRLAAAGFRVILPQPRGVGASIGPAEALTLHDLAADTATVVEAVSGAPVHVIGHAFGNRVARALAARRPALVRSVVLLAAGGKAPVPPDIAQAFADCFRPGLDERRRLDAIARVFFAAGNDPAVWRDGWFPAASELQGAADAATPVDEWWTAGRAPVLVVQGLQDRMAAPENGRLLKAELGGRVTLVELDGASHALLPERPAEIADAVIGFLRSPFSGGSGACR